jgi:5-methylcytosine-specific restriction endonuclease McrA
VRGAVSSTGSSVRVAPGGGGDYADPTCPEWIGPRAMGYWVIGSQDYTGPVPVSKERKAELERARYLSRRQQAVLHLGGCCVHCGSTDDLEFDHVNPASKSFQITRMLCKLPWVALLAELDKCQLLCHPCHRAKSNEETTGPREHGTYQMYHRGKCRCGLCRAAFNTYRRGWRLRSGRTTRSYGPRNTGIV